MLRKLIKKYRSLIEVSKLKYSRLEYKRKVQSNNLLPYLKRDHVNQRVQGCIKYKNLFACRQHYPEEKVLVLWASSLSKCLVFGFSFHHKSYFKPATPSWRPPCLIATFPIPTQYPVYNRCSTAILPDVPHPRRGQVYFSVHLAVSISLLSLFVCVVIAQVLVFYPKTINSTGTGTASYLPTLQHYQIKTVQV